jgi:hypothetical protein
MVNHNGRLTVTDTKAEQASAKTGSTQAGSAVPKAVTPKADAQPAKAEAQPRQKIGALRMAAVVVLAATAGALGGVLATSSDLTHFASAGFTPDDGLSARLPALEASVARIEADIPTLKANAEYTSEISLAKLSETSGRLDRLEKAQAEPVAKLAKLSDAVQKLQSAPVAPAPVAAAVETTSSISPPAAPAPVIAPATEVGKLPQVEGWRLRGVGRGIALIQGRRGLFQVHTGTIIPGVGRVDAIRRQDGRWVVVTAKGLIVSQWRPAASPRREAIASPQ